MKIMKGSHVLVLLFLFLSLSACGGGGSGAGGSGSGGDSGSNVATSQVSGVVMFERVPHDPVTFGLDYASTFVTPARGIKVSAVYLDDSSLADTSFTDETGFYQLEVSEGREIRVRALALMVKEGQPGWNIRVADNTAGNAQYAMESEAVSVSGDVEVNLTATSGWDGGAYTGPRVAAPFAILDTIYQAVELLVAAGLEKRLPDVGVFWSENNRRAQTTDYQAGELSSSHYRSGSGIYLLGSVDEDTEEYDSHVILHEFAHFYLDKLSRSDSIGGSHTFAQRLDHRVAFDEGFATAFSAIATGDPVYRDSGGLGQAGGFGYDVRTNPWGIEGWYGEVSIIKLIFAIAGKLGDGDERQGFAAVHRVLTGELKSEEALISIFPFIHELKQKYPGSSQEISALVQAAKVSEVVDDWATMETNDAGAIDVLPLYRELVVGGPSVNLCVNSQFDSADDGNKLSTRRFLRVEIPEQRKFSLLVEGDELADPRFHLLLKGGGQHYSVASADGRSALLETTLNPGTYVLEVMDRYMIKGEKNGRICMGVSIS